jgi:hypothetical protein
MNIEQSANFADLQFAEFILDRPPLPAKFMYNMKNLRLNKKKPSIVHALVSYTLQHAKYVNFGTRDEPTRFLQQKFFMKPLKIALRSFQIFRKVAEIFASQGAPLVSKIPGANLPAVSTTPVAKLLLVSTTPGANLPPVSTPYAENFATSSAGVVDTSGAP